MSSIEHSAGREDAVAEAPGGGESLVVAGKTFRLPYATSIRPLTDGEYAALSADIAARRAVVVPVVVDEHGHVLDGHHRLRIAQSLGLADIPLDVRAGLSAEQKEALAHDLNDKRRQLTPQEQQRRAMLRRERERRFAEGGWSMRAIAEEEKVSLAQVHRDLNAGGDGTESSSVPGGTEEGARSMTDVGGRQRRRPRRGVGERILELASLHPDWSRERLAQEVDVNPNYVYKTFYRERQGKDAACAAQPPGRRSGAGGSARVTDIVSAQRAAVASHLRGLQWPALEGLLEYAVLERLSAKAVLRLCREIRRDAEGRRGT